MRWDMDLLINTLEGCRDMRDASSFTTELPKLSVVYRCWRRLAGALATLNPGEEDLAASMLRLTSVMVPEY